MKLNDVYTKPLKDVVEELNLTDMKVHTDDDGEVRSIELKLARKWKDEWNAGAQTTGARCTACRCIENLQYAGEGGKAMEQESRVNNPKPWIAQIFCRHHGEWFIRQEPYFNLSGETQYKVCTKCGKKLDERFIANFDGS